MRRLSKTSDETSKQRALRIPLEFVRTLDPIQKWKWSLTFFATVLTLGYVAWILPNGKKRYSPFSPGAITAAHATWEQNCFACHTDFEPLRDDAINPLTQFGLMGTDATPSMDKSPHAKIDAKCLTCHPRGRHHSNERVQDAASCASCHRDHQGKLADIARPADHHCTRCHAKLAEHREGPASKFTPPLGNVVAFHSPEKETEKSHPEFRSLLHDPGNIKFNHALHMAAGIPAFDPKSEGRKLVTLATLPIEFVEKYRGANQPKAAKPDHEYAVQLACASCHRPDADSDKPGLSGALPQPGSNAYMAPIRFDRDCKACHQLIYEGGSEKTLTHGLSPEKIREFLLAKYVAEELKGKPAADLEPVIPKRPIPGRATDEFTKPSKFRHAESQTAATEKFLQDNKTCCKCHSVASLATDRDPTLLPPAMPSNIPARWFRSARFDHGSHQAIACKECHAAAFAPLSAGNPNRSSGLDGLSISCNADDTTGPMDHQIVMIAGRDVCMKCHAPRNQAGTRGGARHDCVECHVYHGTDSLSGGFDQLHAPTKLERKLSVEDFLSGLSTSAPEPP